MKTRYSTLLATIALALLLAACDDSTSANDSDALSSSSSSAPTPSSSSAIVGISSSSDIAVSSSSVAELPSSSSSAPSPIVAESHPAVNYKLERSPKVNRQGVGLDLIHGESTLDTAFLSAGRSFDSDLIFYNVMVYYKSENGDSTSEGSPAILMYTAETGSVAAVQIGKGTTAFDAYNLILPEQIAALQSDPVVDFAALHYGMESIQRDTLMSTYAQLVIGNKFRASVLVIPDGSTEQAEQPVFLVRTREGGYAKFMVTQFQGDGADKQKTLVRWQVLVSP